MKWCVRVTDTFGKYISPPRSYRGHWEPVHHDIVTNTRPNVITGDDWLIIDAEHEEYRLRSHNVKSVHVFPIDDEPCEDAA